MQQTEIKIRPEQLDELHDIYGNELTVGCKVRSFDFAEEISGTIYGMELEGERVGYLEGTLLSIGEVEQEGCHRYDIKVEARFFNVKGELYRQPAPHANYHAFPPVNGVSKTTGGATFGVVRIGDELK